MHASSALLAVCVAAGPASDYASLRQQVVQRLDTFRQSTARAAEASVDVAREQVTITTAEMFLTYT